MFYPTLSPCVITMGKKKEGQVPNKHLHSRISYLWQVANYMSQITNESQDKSTRDKSERQGLDSLRDDNFGERRSLQGVYSSAELATTSTSEAKKFSHSARHTPNINPSQSSRFVSHIRTISLRSQIKLSPGMKHSFCSHCESPLLPGSTSTSEIENRSRGGRKPWADVLVVTCKLCGTAKRSPIGAKPQPKRKERRRS